jgi:hypothetical protein
LDLRPSADDEPVQAQATYMLRSDTASLRARLAAVIAATLLFERSGDLVP